MPHFAFDFTKQHYPETDDRIVFYHPDTTVTESKYHNDISKVLADNIVAYLDKCPDLKSSMYIELEDIKIGQQTFLEKVISDMAILGYEELNINGGFGISRDYRPVRHAHHDRHDVCQANVSREALYNFEFHGANEDEIRDVFIRHYDEFYKLNDVIVKEKKVVALS